MTILINRLNNDDIKALSKMEGEHFVQLLQQQVVYHFYTVGVYMLLIGG